MPASENQWYFLLFGEGSCPCIPLQISGTLQWELEGWLHCCSCCYTGAPQFCLLGLGSSTDARLSESNFHPLAFTLLAAVLFGRSERKTFWISRELSTLNLSCDHDQGGRSIFFLVGLLLRRPACQMRLRIFCDMCIPLQTRAGWSSHTRQMQRLSTTFLLICMFGWWPCWFPELFSPLAEMVLAAKHPHILSFARHSSWILLFTKSNVKSFEKWRHPFKSTFGHVKCYCPTRTCPRYLSCLPYPGHSDTWPCESCLCLGSLLEMCGAGVQSIFCQQLTCKELPCGTGGNERSQLEERPKELKGKLKGHVLDQRNKVLVNMICVHLYVNEAHSVWLPRVLLGRIFRRAEACSLISSCCCGACSWDIHRLLQPGHGLSAHMSWKSAVLTQSVAENEGNATFPPCANGARETEQWMVFWDREGRSFWSQLFEATVAWHVATLCISPSRACLKKRKRDGKWVFWPMGGLRGLPRWNASLLTLQILSSGLVKLPSYGRDFSRGEVAASYFILS